jgi:hypothetical protein
MVEHKSTVTSTERHSTSALVAFKHCVAGLAGLDTAGKFHAILQRQREKTLRSGTVVKIGVIEKYPDMIDMHCNTRRKLSIKEVG